MKHDMAQRYRTKLILSKKKNALCSLSSSLDRPARCTCTFITSWYKDQGHRFCGSRTQKAVQVRSGLAKCMSQWQMHCMLQRMHPGSMQAILIPISPPTSAKSKNKKSIWERWNKETSPGFMAGIMACVFLNWKIWLGIFPPSWFIFLTILRKMNAEVSNHGK